jgi:hypothetical protein
MAVRNETTALTRCQSPDLMVVPYGHQSVLILLPATQDLAGDFT